MLNLKTVLFQIIQSSISSQFKELNIKAVISKHLFSFTWPIDKTLSGTITPDQSDGNERVLSIP